MFEKSLYKLQRKASNNSKLLVCFTSASNTYRSMLGIKAVKSRKQKNTREGGGGGRNNEMIHVLFSVMWGGGGGCGEFVPTTSAETGLSEV